MKIEEYRGPYTPWRGPYRFGSHVLAVGKYGEEFCYEIQMLMGEFDEVSILLARQHGFDNPIDAEAAARDFIRGRPVFKSTPPDGENIYALN